MFELNVNGQPLDEAKQDGALFRLGIWALGTFFLTFAIAKSGVFQESQPRTPATNDQDR